MIQRVKGIAYSKQWWNCILIFEFLDCRLLYHGNTTRRCVNGCQLGIWPGDQVCNVQSAKSGAHVYYLCPCKAWVTTSVEIITTILCPFISSESVLSTSAAVTDVSNENPKCILHETYIDLKGLSWHNAMYQWTVHVNLVTSQ